MLKFKACLTGGIASGKTHVSDRLADLGACIIDADILARQVVSKGSDGLARIVESFGVGILNAEQELSREKLKRLVFQDRDKLNALNSIVHPLIRQAFKEVSARSSNPIEIWVIPLFDGSAHYPGFDRILAVDVCLNIQLKRVMQRDNASIELAQNIIDSQPPRMARLKLATDVICNNSSFASLNKSIALIFALYKKLMVNQSR